VVANATMNRERVLRGPNSYSKDLGVDLLTILSERLASQGSVAWLDLCCGAGRALQEAAARLEELRPSGGLDLVGVDLVRMPTDLSPRPGLRLIEANLERWTTDERFDLVTCVHGLHYVGDKLGLIQKASGWLRDGGSFLAHLDLVNIRLEPRRPAARRIMQAFRKAGVQYGPRSRVLRVESGQRPEFGLDYLGADDTAGPNSTGQPAVNSIYRRRAPKSAFAGGSQH